VVLGDKSIRDAQRPRSEADDRAEAVRRQPAARLDFPWRATPASGPTDGSYAILARPDGHGSWEAACLDMRGVVVRGLPTKDDALAAVRRKSLQMISWRQQNDELRTLPGGVRFVVALEEPGNVAELVPAGRNPGSVLGSALEDMAAPLVGVAPEPPRRATRRSTARA
jgi:hypothetical protein